MIPDTYQVLPRRLPTRWHQHISGRFFVLFRKRMITTWSTMFMHSRMGVLTTMTPSKIATSTFGIECWFLWSRFCCFWQGATLLGCLLVSSLSAVLSMRESISVSGKARDTLATECVSQFMQTACSQFSFFSFGDDSHQRDARHSRHRED